MGKRKLHNTHFYQCDWTGFAMQDSNCYMPSWTLEGKLIKKGSYCNWESVIAHARYIYEVEKQLEDKDLDRITEHINGIVGVCITTDAPHFQDLEHVKASDVLSLTAEEYHEKCCYQSNEIYAVLIDEQGQTSELSLDSNNGKFDFAAAMGHEHKLCSFRSYRKGKNKDKELNVMHFEQGMGWKINTLASSLFKMQIFGPVLMVQCTKEASFRPRTRYVNFMQSEFEEAFTRKRKRQAEVAVDSGEYSKLKEKMQSSLAAYEASASSLALPAAKAGHAHLPPANGRQLAALVATAAPVGA